MEGGRKGEKRMQRRNSTATSLPALFIAVQHVASGINTCPQGDHSRMSAHTDILIPFTFHLQGKLAFSRKKGRLPLHGQHHVFIIMLSPSHTHARTHHGQVIECALQLDSSQTHQKIVKLRAKTVAKLLITEKTDLF